MDAKNQEPELTDAEIDERRDDAIRRALSTPPKPHKEMVGKEPRDGSARKKPRKRT